MAEALAQIKRQFGREAVILSTRNVAQSGLFRFGAKGCVEITAARAMSDLPPAVRPATVKARGEGGQRAEGAARNVPPTRQALTTHSSDQLLSEIGALKSLVTDLARETRCARAGTIPEGLHDTYLQLVQNEVAEQIAQQLVDTVHRRLTADQRCDPVAVRTELAAALEAMLPMSGPIHLMPTGGPTVIALVGPTGVGKTTTVAKLAANFRLREQRNVGLITMDTYRIGAVEQLRTYAQIIDVPLKVVVSPAELKEAVAHMADRDIILIDTAGRSQRDAAKVNELQEFFHAVRPHEVHLVLSGASGEAILAEALERFSGVGIDRVIMTKLDEAIGFGVILTCLERAQTGLSYLTMGQDVPDDISVGEGKALAELILGEPVSPP